VQPLDNPVAYNSNAIVVNVCSLVKLFFKFGMLDLGPSVVVSTWGNSREVLFKQRAVSRMYSLNTTRVQRRLVDALRYHGSDFVQ
jgi:hypothetical protein